MWERPVNSGLWEGRKFFFRNCFSTVFAILLLVLLSDLETESSTISCIVFEGVLSTKSNALATFLVAFLVQTWLYQASPTLAASSSDSMVFRWLLKLCLIVGRIL